MAELVAGPVAEPLTRAQVKDFLRIDHDDEDALVDALISAARRFVEAHTGRVLMAQSWRLTRDGWPGSGVLVSPVAPVRAILAAQVRGLDGQDIAVPEEALMVGRGGSGLIHVDLLHVPQAMGRDAVSIIVEAGYGADAADVPADLVQAVRLLAAHFYEHREGAGDATRLPEVVRTLLAPYRLVRL